MKEREYCAECRRDLSEIDNDYLHDRYHMLADRVGHIRMDLNKIMSEYLDIMLKLKEDHDIMRQYLQQDRGFQKWTAKMALTNGRR
tara:strand:+ start:11710 stop:11967 length:258 start_codon:yes stop_codon:yes gene_type:complete